MKKRESAKESRGFALLLAVSLTWDAVSFVCGFGYNLDNTPWTACIFGAAGISIGLKWFAHGNYPKKWQPLVLGAPFALFWPVVLLPLIAAHYFCLFKHPGGCPDYLS